MKQNDLVKIRVYRGKSIKNGKKKIPTYYTKMMIRVKGEEDQGKQLKSVTLKFVTDVDSSNITNGILTCYLKDVSYPSLYEITFDEEKEKNVYPTVWIRGFKDFKEIEIDVENPFVTDEPETEETEIPEEIE